MPRHLQVAPGPKADDQGAVGALLHALAGVEDELRGVGGGLRGEAPDHVVGLLLEQPEGAGGAGAQVEAGVAVEGVGQFVGRLYAGPAEQGSAVSPRVPGQADPNRTVSWSIKSEPLRLAHAGGLI